MTARSGLETLIVSAGKVDVSIEPRQVDDEVTVFTISLDTHSVELGADLTLAHLQVGTTRPGPGRGGRETGPAATTARASCGSAPPAPPQAPRPLTIPGLPEPMEASWQLDG